MNMETIIQYAGYAVAVLTALISLYRAHKQGKTAAEALIVMANTLKDESKLHQGSFAPETLRKAEEVGRAIQANNQAIEQVKSALEGREIDLKIASWKGKPLYLSDVFKVGGAAKAIRNIVK